MFPCCLCKCHRKKQNKSTKILWHSSPLHNRINAVIEPFLSLVSSSFFQQTVWSVRIVQTEYGSVFSRQTFHSTGGTFQCTFHLFLMAGPSGSGVRSPLPLALSSSEGSLDGEGKRLEVGVVLSLSTILRLPWILSLLWGQDVSWD